MLKTIKKLYPAATFINMEPNKLVNRKWVKIIMTLEKGIGSTPWDSNPMF